MGLGYMGLAGDLEAIASLFSSRDVERYDALMNSDVSFVRSLLRLDEDGRDADDRKNAVRDIFVGARCEAYKPHHYGYVMEAACFHFAESLGEVGAGYGAIYDAEEVVQAAGGEFSLLPQMKVEWFVPIPAMVDWPTVATMTATECREKATGLARVIDELPEDVDWISREFIETFQRWYQTCTETDRDLIIIAH
jgi:hypothetical protein